VLEAQVDRYAAGGEAATHGVAKVNRTATTTSATARQSHGQFATQRSKRALELGHLVSIACMTSRSSGSGLRTDLARASDPRSSTDARITRSISAFSISMRERLFASESLGELVVVAGSLRETPLEVLEVEVAQRSIEVIGPPDGATGLHTRVAGDRFAGRETKRLAIRVTQRAKEQLGQFLGAERA